MGVPDTNLNDLERQRLELEGNILKLQESLYHWRTWEAEYDGLKEGINDLDDDATTDDFFQVARDFGGDLVNDNEVKVILGEKQGVSRSRKQVVDLLSRRIDYVKQNIATMEKRLRAAEDQLYALDSVGQQLTETGKEFPMTEIMEEIDEDGNVISGSTSTPGDQAPELLEVLKKAGVKDIPDAPKAEPQPSTSHEDSETEDRKKGKEVKREEPEEERPGSSGIAASDDDEGPEFEYVEEVMPTSADQPSENTDELAVREVEESPEDAKLRSEMLRYGLDEVGAVVAELELDDDASDISFDDGYDYDSDEDEEEDEHGRTKGRILDEDYHQQMRELEAKLNARGMWNMGKDTDTLPADVQQELKASAVVKIDKDVDEMAEPAPAKKPKKKVAFSDVLDIAPTTTTSKPSASETKTPAPRQSNVQVLSESIVERTEQPDKGSVTAEPPKKASRFKSARKATAGENEGPVAPVVASASNSRPTEIRSSLRKPNASSASPSSSLPLFPAKPAEPKPFSQPISDVIEKPSSTPQPPKDKIVADKLLEREISQGDAVAPEPDELDENLHRKEIATEFYRMRNNKIHENGGFLNDEEPEIVPIETEDAPKRVSKFKAARMR